MKSHLLLFFITTGAISGATPLLPRFSDELGPPPQLSLSEAAKSGQLPLTSQQPNTTHARSRDASREKRYVSRMPIVTPRENIDPNMPILSPDPAIDLKLQIKKPNVDAVR